MTEMGDGAFSGTVDHAAASFWSPCPVFLSSKGAWMQGLGVMDQRREMDHQFGETDVTEMGLRLCGRN